MPNTIVYLTRREHHQLMAIAKDCETSPAYLCYWELVKVARRFHDTGELPMLPRARFRFDAEEYKGYRRVTAKLKDQHVEWIKELAATCHVSEDYIARLAVTRFIGDVFHKGLDPAWRYFVRSEMADEANISFRPDRFCGSHAVRAGPLGTLGDRQPRNPRD